MLKCASFVVKKAVYCLSKFLPLSLQQNQALLQVRGNKESKNVVFLFFFFLPQNE